MAAPVATPVPQLPPQRPSPPREQHDLFPEPILFELLGKELARPNCTGSEAEVERCCAAACNTSSSCEFWVMDRNAGPCRLKHSFSGLGPTGPDGSRGMFKSSASLKMADVLPARPLEEDLAQLRRELARPCPEAHWKQPNSGNASRIKAWVKWALEQEDGQVQGFPEHDVLLSSKTCIDRKLQFAEINPFYLLKQSPKGAPEATPPPELRETWRPQDILADVNIRAFEMVHKPGCTWGQPIWDYLTWAPPRSEFRGSPSEMRLPPIRDAAVSDSDVWSNIGHALQHIIFLGPAMHADFLKLPNQTVEMVPAQHSWFFRDLPPLFQVLYEAQGLGKAVKEEVRFGYPNLAPPPRCYNLVAQRFRMWPSSPSRYTHRKDVLRHCGIPDRGMRPKMLLWYKKDAGHNIFANHDWVVRSIKQWVNTTDLHLEAKELNDREVQSMTACEQMGLFADLALFVGVHGAAGIHMLWLPPGAVYMEIAPEGNMARAPRTSAFGYYSEPTAMGGRLYLRYQHVVPLRFVRFGPQIFNKYLALDPRELVAVLQVLYTEWIKPRVGASQYGADY